MKIVSQSPCVGFLLHAALALAFLAAVRCARAGERTLVPRSAEVFESVRLGPHWETGKRYHHLFEMYDTVATGRDGGAPLPNTANRVLIEAKITVVRSLENGGWELFIDVKRVRCAPLGDLVLRHRKARPIFDSDSPEAEDLEGTEDDELRALSRARFDCIADRHGSVQSVRLGEEINQMMQPTASSAVKPFGNKGQLLKMLLDPGAISDWLSLIPSDPQHQLRRNESMVAPLILRNGPGFFPRFGPGVRIVQTNYFAGIELHDRISLIAVESRGSILPPTLPQIPNPDLNTPIGTTSGRFLFDPRRDLFVMSSLTRQFYDRFNGRGNADVRLIVSRNLSLKLLGVEKVTPAELASPASSSRSAKMSAAPRIQPSEPSQNAFALANKPPRRDGTIDLRVKWPVGGKVYRLTEISRSMEVPSLPADRGGAREISITHEWEIDVARGPTSDWRMLDARPISEKVLANTSPVGSLPYPVHPRHNDHSPRNAVEPPPNNAVRFVTDGFGRIESAIGVYAFLTNRFAASRISDRGIVSMLLTPDVISGLVEPRSGLPDRPVAVGDTWTTRRNVSLALFPAMFPSDNIAMTVTNRFVRWEQAGSARVARIEFDGKIAFKNPNQVTDNFTIETSRVTGHYAFDPTRGQILRTSMLQEISIVPRIGPNPALANLKIEALTQVIDAPPSITTKKASP
jgi:hypothetical protein